MALCPRHFAACMELSGCLWLFVCPRRVMVDRRGEASFYTSADITACMARVTPLQLHQTIVIDGDIEVTPFYAGHVLG